MINQEKKNYVVIFAGGTGQRMNSVSVPKQFLVVHGKPIIVHTIEKFQNCEKVDGIVVVSLESYKDYIYELKNKYGLTKIVDVVSGGESGQLSIYNGLVALEKISKSDNDIVLIHDGVRPIIDNDTIIRNIDCVEKNGSAITVAKSAETVLIANDINIENVVDRSKCYLGRAPQGFIYKEIMANHKKALKEGITNFIDSAMLMKHYNKELFMIDGPANNIKITTSMDFFMFKAYLDALENDQIKLL